MPLKQRKIAVMGSRSVGKSSLVIQFVQVAGDVVITVVAVVLIVLVDGQLDILVLADAVLSSALFRANLLTRTTPPLKTRSTRQ